MNTDNRTAMCVDHMPIGASDVDYVLSGKVECAEHRAEAHRRDMFTGFGWTDPTGDLHYPDCHLDGCADSPYGHATMTDWDAAIAANTAPPTMPCPICGRIEPHPHTRQEWWDWETNRKTES